jgi:putative ABC transport system ATP-binding protein
MLTDLRGADHCRMHEERMNLGSFTVDLQGVTRDYSDHGIITRALRGVDLQVGPREFTAMAGPSGSGKTTLLNIIGGLDRPTSGSVRIEGTDITTLSGADLSRLRRDRIGFVFQSYNLIPILSAYENAEYVMMLRGVPEEFRRQRVMQVLQEVGLGGLEHRRPRELSGGQQQRVAIARAIAPEPALVLADEPTANLDSTTGQALLELMLHLNEQKGVTFLFSTHDHAVMECAHRLIHLRDGRIVEDRRLFTNPHDDSAK